MDLQTVKDVAATVFARDLRDGTLEIGADPSSLVLDGGNWSLTAHRSGVVRLDLPADDPNYYDADPDVFLDNVFSLEVEQSLALLDRTLDGALTAGLRRSGEAWSGALARRVTPQG